MATKVKCPRCGVVLSVQDDMAGKMAKCSQCEQMMRIPAPLQREQDAHPGPVAAAGPTMGDIPGEPAEFPKDMSPAKERRPFGLVWVVFYWIIGGLVCLPSGYFLAVMGGALGRTTEATRDMFPFRGFGEAALQAVILEFLGVMVFHYGLLLLVACYGLWTYRRWGLSLARGLSVASVVLNLVTLITCIVYRAGIVASLVGVLISAGILVYLYGSANLRDRLQRYTGGLNSGEWNQYR